MTERLSKTIQIFLDDGTPEGLRELQIKGRTERMYVVARIRLGEIADWRQQLSKTGVYVLLTGDHEEMIYTIYIGQSDDVYRRVMQHDGDAQYDWETVIFMTSTDDNLHGAVARYLESRLIEIARQARRARLKNSVEPERPSLSRADRALAEEMLDSYLTLLPVAGFHFATPQTVTLESATAQLSSVSTSPTFEIRPLRSGVRAKAREINGKFVVLRGSQACLEVQRSFRSANRRAQLIEQGILVQQGNFLVFQEDVVFDSPSGAAMMVVGASVNGWQYWIAEGTSKTYGAWKAEQRSA
jgi:predicted GIY-YIG superfamily endonuclease